MTSSEERRYSEDLVREFIEYVERASRHDRLISEWSLIALESVHVDHSTAMPKLVVTFRHDYRPACLFGFTTAARAEGEVDAYPPDLWAPILAVNLGEAIEAEDMGLPAECPENGVAWLPCDG